MKACPFCGGTQGCCCGGAPPTVFHLLSLHLLVYGFPPIFALLIWLFGWDERAQLAFILTILTMIAARIVWQKPAFWLKIPTTWKVVLCGFATVFLGFFWAVVIFKEN